MKPNRKTPTHRALLPLALVALAIHLMIALTGCSSAFAPERSAEDERTFQLEEYLRTT